MHHERDARTTAHKSPWSTVESIGSNTTMQSSHGGVQSHHINNASVRREWPAVNPTMIETRATRAENSSNDR